MKASDIKKGIVIEADGASVFISEVQVQTASSRSGNTLYKVRGRNVVTRQKFQGSYKGDEVVQTVEFERRPVQFLYQDGPDYHFMESDTYEQFHLTAEQLGDVSSYLVEGMSLDRTSYQGETIGVELPTSVDLRVTETEPGFAGDTQSGAKKPATLESGLVVQVPIFVNEGDVIKVDTRTGEYLTRV